MTGPCAIARYDAYRALLALPDPVDLPPRARRYVFAGDPNRRERLKLHAERAYLRWRYAKAAREESEIVSVRRRGRLSLARSA